MIEEWCACRFLCRTMEELKGKTVRILVAGGKEVVFPAEKLAASGLLSEKALEAFTAGTDRLDTSKRDRQVIEVLMVALLLGVDTIGKIDIPVDPIPVVLELGAMRLEPGLRRAFVDRIVACRPGLSLRQMGDIDKALGPPTGGWPFTRTLKRKRDPNSEMVLDLMRFGRETLRELCACVDIDLN